MLVLSRVRGEQIVIGEGIVVTVLEVGRGRVRLGIEAPPHCAIRRQELSPQARATARDPLAVGERGQRD